MSNTKPSKQNQKDQQPQQQTNQQQKSRQQKSRQQQGANRKARPEAPKLHEQEQPETRMTR